MSRLVDIARAATTQEAEHEDVEAQIRRLVAKVYDKDTTEDQVEALRYALAEPDKWIEFYRWRISPAYDEFQKERFARAEKQKAVFLATGTLQ